MESLSSMKDRGNCKKNREKLNAGFLPSGSNKSFCSCLVFEFVSFPCQGEEKQSGGKEGILSSRTMRNCSLSMQIKHMIEEEEGIVVLSENERGSRKLLELNNIV